MNKLSDGWEMMDLDETNSFYSPQNSTSKYFAVKGQPKNDTIKSYNKKLNNVLESKMLGSDSALTVRTNSYSNAIEIQKATRKEDILVTFALFMIDLSEFYDNIDIIRNFREEFNSLQNKIISYASLLPIYFKNKNFTELSALSSKLLNEDIIPFIKNILDTKFENNSTLESVIGKCDKISTAFNYLYKDIINDFARYSPDNFNFDLNVGAPIFNNVQQEWIIRKDRVSKLINLYLKKIMFEDLGDTYGMITYLNKNSEDEKIIYNKLLSSSKKKTAVELSAKAIKMIGYTDSSVKELLGCSNLVLKRIKNESSTPEGNSTCPGLFTLFSWMWPYESKSNVQENRIVVKQNIKASEVAGVALAVATVGTVGTVVMMR